MCYFEKKKLTRYTKKIMLFTDSHDVLLEALKISILISCVRVREESVFLGRAISHKKLGGTKKPR